ncbi:MAG: hypothetical protein OEZ21_00335 [Candidatus Bathyarchaeota archaeon]|nr:hypothetical protein [Candidatus Bathyarchaeota archaeon]
MLVFYYLHVRRGSIEVPKLLLYLNMTIKLLYVTMFSHESFEVEAEARTGERICHI